MKYVFMNMYCRKKKTAGETQIPNSKMSLHVPQQYVKHRNIYRQLLDTRIRLLVRMVAREPVTIPLITSGLESTCISNGALDLAPALHELHAQSLRCVEGDVAVHDPHTWVICRECNEEVTVGGEGSGITTQGVLERQAASAAIPSSGTRANNIEIVAVEMDRMG